MRRALLAAALLVGALTPSLAAVPARAAAIARCSTTRGTIVAVDFAHFGGPLVRGCGVTSSGAADSSGLALLEDGGFTPVGTRQYGLAFVCRLGNAAFAGGAAYPTTAQTSCNQTPPASATWLYWLAKPGATSWTYSPDGVSTDRPVAGGVELWTFGSTSDPSPSATLIGELRAKNAPVASSPAPPEPTTAAAPTRPASAVPTRSAAPSAAATGSASRTAAASVPSSTASRRSASGPAVNASAPSSAGGTGSPASPRVVDAVATPTAHHSSGSPLPVILAAALVALLAAGAGAAAWQRRRG